MFLWRGHLSFYAPTTNPIFELILLKSLSSFSDGAQEYMQQMPWRIFPTDTKVTYGARFKKSFVIAVLHLYLQLREPPEIFWWQIKPQMMVAVTRHSLTHSEVSTSARSPLHIRFNRRAPRHQIWTIVAPAARLSRLARWCRNYNLTIIASAFSFLMSRFHSWDRQRASNPVA